MALQFKKNEVIQEKYRIIEKLGEGGMSVVYKAGDIGKKNKVAIKFLKPGITSSYIEDVIRFKKEVELVSKLDHANIVKCHGAGEYKTVPFIITEIIQGSSLAQFIRANKKLSIKEVIDILKQLLEALSYVHSKGVVHRDIKPGNIMIQKSGKTYSVKLLDFGLSQIMELGQIKGEEEIIGTFGYMSPEATGIVKKPIDERSDLYSLGLVLYNLLTGDLPFKAKHMNTILHQQVAKEPPKLRKIQSDIPAILEEIVLKLLFKEPELRYQSATGLLFDIQRYEKGEKEFIIGEKDQKVKLTYQTRLVGREQEIEKIKSLFNRARNGEGNICLISGEAGVGKTRLVESLQEYAYELGYEEGGLFIRGRCLNQENKMPYQPFRDSLNEYINKAERMEVKEKDKEKKRLKKVLGQLGEIIIRLNPNTEQFLGDMPDLVALDPERENQRFLMVSSRFFCNLGMQDNICILFLDDLQWADEGSLRLLEELEHSIRKSNLLILGTYRDNEVGKDHSLSNLIKRSRESDSSVEQIKLESFSQERLTKMVAGILGEREEKAGDIAKYVLEKSGGNPFFAINIIRQLVEEKGLTWKQGFWEPDWDRIKKIPISGNILDIILRRIGELTKQQSEILYLSSAIGREFEINLLYPLVDLKKEEVVKIVDEAINMQLIQEGAEKGKKIFVHDKIRDAFYEKVGKKKRRELHLKIARTLEDMNRKNVDNVIFDLAHHFTEAGDKDKSLEYVLPAAYKAKQNYGNEEAIRYFLIGIDLLIRKGRESDKECIRAKESLTEVYLTIGRNDEAIAMCEKLLPLKKMAIEKARIIRKMGMAYFKKGHWEDCENTMADGLRLIGIKIARTKGEIVFSILKELFVHILHNVFPRLFAHRKGKFVREEDKEIIWFYITLNWRYILSDISKFICNILKMLNIADSKIGKSNELAISLGAYASLCMAIPLFKRAIKYHEKTIKLKKELKDEWSLAQSLQFTGYCYSWKADYPRAIEYYSESREKFEKIGDMWELGMVIQGLGLLYRLSGDYKGCLDHLYQYLDISKRLKDVYGISSALSNICTCYVEKGDFEQAETIGKDAMKTSRENKVWFIYCSANNIYGFLKIEKGDFKEAIKHLLRARDLYLKNDFLKEYLVVLFTNLAEAYIMQYNSRKEKIKDHKELKKEIKIIKNTCKEALKQTKAWPGQYGAALRVWGKYYALIKKNKIAENYFLKSIEQTISVGRKLETARSYYEYGLFLDSNGKVNEAKNNWQTALGIFKEIGADEYIKRCTQVLGIKKVVEQEEEITTQDRLQLERRMTTVLNTSRYLSSILDLDELLEKIMDRTIELVGAERGLLFLYPDKDEGKEIELETKVVRGVKSDESSTFKMSKSILDKVIKSKEPLIIDDASTNADLKAQASIVGKGFKSVLCAPIVTKNELLGIIYLDNHLVSGLFKEEDLRILELISSQAGVSIENARLYKKSIIKERIEQDMEIAGTIQKLFLPKTIEVIKKVSIDAYYSPAEFIGGDYYDVIKIDKDRYAIILVDISGHGSSAAIVMSVISFIVHSVVEKVKNSAELTAILNRRLAERLQAEKYATGIVMIYNTKKETMEYTNAGHSDVIVYKKKKDKIEEYHKGGTPIGVVEEAQYEKEVFKFEKGDIILLETDGIYETMNEKKQQFGLERVKKLLVNYKDKDVKEINQFMMSEVERFKGEGVPQGDDITILTLKKTE